jgi:hypothetical protein
MQMAAANGSNRTAHHRPPSITISLLTRLNDLYRPFLPLVRIEGII